MSLRITLDLSDKDIAHFTELAKQAMAASQTIATDNIIAEAKALLKDVDAKVESDYIRSRLGQLGVLIDMLEDEGWGMKEVGQQRVLAALAYFCNPENLIPDSVPGLGYLDDAIMVELLTRELKPEIEAYRDFVVYRRAEAKRRGMDPDKVGRADFTEAKEAALLARMRRRRRRSGGGSRTGRSPFSLFRF